MKRVKYAAGAVMLTPVALAVPAAAQAATTTAAPSTTRGKTVSMHGVRVHPDTCTGTSNHAIGAHPNSHARGQFWETRFNPGSVCIGTVDVSLFFTKTFSKEASVTVRSMLGGSLSFRVEDVHGTAGHWAAGAAFPIKTVFTGDGVLSMNVCITSQFDGGKQNCHAA